MATNSEPVGQIFSWHLHEFKATKVYEYNFIPICYLVSACLKKCLVQPFIVTVLLHHGVLLLNRLKAEAELDERHTAVQCSYGDLKCFVVVTSRQQPNHSKVE